MARKRRGGRVSTSSRKSKETNGGSGDTSEEEASNGTESIARISAVRQQNRRSWLTFAGVVLIAAVAVLAAFSIARIGDSKAGKKGVTDQENASLGGDDAVSSDGRLIKKQFDIHDVFGNKYEVLEVIPHDTKAFTQGLSYHDGVLYEGTGMHGESQLRKLDPSNGNVLQSHSMDKRYFGEGIAHFKNKDGADRIIQLTWREKAGFIYDANTLDVLEEFTFSTASSEGWGITFDAGSNEFLVSDGSSLVLVWDGSTLEEKRRIEVKIPRADDNGDISWHPVKYLNELEWVRGRILANVWYQDVLLSINPQTGRVEKVWDFSDLYKPRRAGADCFNGVSVSGVDGELFVTGKNWPHIYRIKLIFD